MFEFHHFERGLGLLKRRHIFNAFKFSVLLSLVLVSGGYFASMIHEEQEFRYKLRKTHPRILNLYYDIIEYQGYPMRELDKHKWLVDHPQDYK